jgi:4-hydroxyphenylpyruvate dioxygenase
VDGGLGLTHIDHLALSLAADQLDTWILFSRAVLALEVGDSIDLPDPFGLVRTSSVATADRSVRLLLNVSQSRRTGTARTVALHGGKPAVHNIAIACQDIFATVARLRQRGFAFVDVSPNVYDDLVARFALAPALAQKMRQLGVLYDRNATGEYFHAYGQPFAGRFSFELVQRQGYDAYGALNGAARMAAQTQVPPEPQQNWNRLL